MTKTKTKTKSFVISSMLAIAALTMQFTTMPINAKSVLSAEICSANVQKLTSEITWHKSLSKAEDDAARQGKLIVWVHMLGKIDGSTSGAGNSLRAVSLSSEPIFSMLKNDFVVGYTNIENKKYAGASGKHKPDETAIDTTNGAGPHNLQIFVLAHDGTIMTCLPGYWKGEDLAKELTLAKQLGKVWQDSSLSLEEKKLQFSQLQLDHIASHPQDMKARSHLQGFDLQYELKNRPNSDFFYSARAIDSVTLTTPPRNVKTVDIVMHQRLAAHPFEPYERFDVATYADYGKPIYDKHEQFLDINGKITEGSDLGSAPTIGNTPKAHPIKTQAKRTGSRVARTTVNQAVRYGIRALLH